MRLCRLFYLQVLPHKKCAESESFLLFFSPFFLFCLFLKCSDCIHCKCSGFGLLLMLEYGAISTSAVFICS